jgi:hypothetical protein
VPVILLKPFILQVVNEAPFTWGKFWYDFGTGLSVGIALLLLPFVWKLVTKKSIFPSIKWLFTYIWIFLNNPLTFHAALDEYRANQIKKIPLRGEVVYDYRMRDYGVKVHNDTDKFNYLDEIHLVNELGKTVEIFAPRLKQGEKLNIAIPPKSHSNPHFFFINMRSIGKGFRAYLTMRNGELLETEFFPKIEIKEPTS